MLFKDYQLFCNQCDLDKYFNINVYRLQERQKLDRRRIEDAFFQYAILTVVSWYSQHFSLCQLPMHNMASETVTGITEKYHGLFMSHYSSKLHYHSVISHNFGPHGLLPRIYLSSIR